MQLQGIAAGGMRTPGQMRRQPDASQQGQAFQAPLPARAQPAQQQPSQPQRAPQMPQYSTQPRTQPGPTQGALNGAPPLTYLQQGVKMDPRNQTGFRNNPGRGYAGDAPAAPAFDFSGLFEATQQGGGYGGGSAPVDPNINWNWVW